MNDPIKVVYKYKNNNRKVQYQYYIFLGALLPDKIKKIVKSIQALDLYGVLTFLSKQEQDELIKFYGEFWYKKLFLLEHINASIEAIKSSVQKRTTLIRANGKEWYDTHIGTEQKQIKQPMHSFGDKFILTRSKSSIIEPDGDDIDTDINDFTQKGGDDEEDGDGDEDRGDDTELLFDSNQSTQDDGFNLEEAEQLYKQSNTTIEKNAETMKDLIDDAIKKDNTKNITKKEANIKFNNDKNDNNYDELLKNVYEKVYVFNTYIFKTDTINTIKEKIAINIHNNSIFDTSMPYIIPSRMYLWSEYMHGNKNNKIMIGQKWIKNNELLNVDVEPVNNLLIYQKLKGQLKTLHDLIKKTNSRIRFEDDNNNILTEYEDYYTNNELFMIDIYNELGKDITLSTEEINALFQVYTKIYFFGITSKEFEGIVKYVNGDKNEEKTIIEAKYTPIYNNITLENEITNTIEDVKIKGEKYESILKQNYIIQCDIYCFLVVTKKAASPIAKINLYKIFDSFLTTEKYPFVRFKSPDNTHMNKILDKIEGHDNSVLSSKWFENESEGINFKIRIQNSGEKIISVTIYDTGRLEYKITWKEDEKATHDNVVATYKDIMELITKINKDTKHTYIEIPTPDMFKYAFINSIVNFVIPEKHNINHNVLSDFARFFFPYVSVVIEPKKRESSVKTNTSSKFGTYLRYKRVSKFENDARIDARIIYFLRNYEYIHSALTTEISKQFNITEKEASVKIENIIKQYPFILRQNKTLKKFQNVARIKAPGIELSIQGKTRDNYKIRIGGARSKEQMDDILTFSSIFLWLYVDTFIYKNPKRVAITKKLKELTHIAKRRNMVMDIVQTNERDENNVKEMVKLDSERLGKESGASKYSTLCQNSGDKDRRPTIYSQDTVDKMLAQGYKYNEKTQQFEREVKVKGKKVLLVAAKPNPDKSIYYTCNPEKNGEYTYIGFLSKSGVDDLCIPCCFKKNHAESDNITKRNHYFKCMGKKVDNKVDEGNEGTDNLYILQNHNKTTPGRFTVLHPILEELFNGNRNSFELKNNYLISTNGYYMNYGVKTERYPYLHALSSVINMKENDIIGAIEKAIKNENTWLYANNGDIATQFRDKKDFINTLKTNTELDYTFIDDFIGLSGVITPKGINTYIFNVNNDIYTLECKSIENIHNYKDKSKDVIIFVNNAGKITPIVYIIKDEKERDVNFTGLFKGTDRVVDIINQYTNTTCEKISFEDELLNAKATYLLMRAQKVNIESQVIDNHNKCIGIISNGFIVPTKPSGIIHSLKFVREYPKRGLWEYINFIDNMRNVLHLTVTGVQYEGDENEIMVKSVIFVGDVAIDVTEEKMNKSKVKERLPNIMFETVTINDEINSAIISGEEGKRDKRVMYVEREKYNTEHYQLFRYEMANYINMSVEVRRNIIKIIDGKEGGKTDKLFEILMKIITQNNVFTIIKNQPDTTRYKAKNIREVCSINKGQDKCDKNIHCVWNNKCKFGLTEQQATMFISKVIDELLHNELKSNELLSKEGYFIQDVININNFTHRKGQKIIKSTNINVNKIFSELFGQGNIPMMGKKRLFKASNDIISDEDKKLKNVGNKYYQKIVLHKAIFRAYANSIYWLKSLNVDKNKKNLGYYSVLQTDITNTFYSYIYSWITNEIKMKQVYDKVKRIVKIPFNVFYEEYRAKIFVEKEFYYLGVPDLTIMYFYHKIPIIIYDNFGDMYLYIDKNGASMGKYEGDEKAAIKIQYISNEMNIHTYPQEVNVIYM